MLSHRRFLTDQRGNAAIMFGLAIVPVLAISGGAVDLSHRADIRMKVQSASDTAALAAARAMQVGQDNKNDDKKARKTAAENAAKAIFAAALANRPDAHVTPRVDIKDDVVSISADANVDTAFLSLIGISTLPADGYAEVKVPSAIPVEIALVLDYSKSMLDNNKYSRMTAAAQDFIQRVGSERGKGTKIGIVPFSEYVYASLPGSAVRGTPASASTTAKTGCFSNREYPYAATSDTPNPSTEASRWRLVDPADPDCQGYAATMSVRDLTDDFSGLSDALSAMAPIGLTNISLAAELGWQLLTPNSPYETAAYSTKSKKVQKVMILLTDGVQTVPASGPGGGTSTDAANATTAELCTNAKDSGVQIYTIAYDVDDTSAYKLLSDCASGPSAYHEVHDSSNIGGVFDAIYARLAATVWLSR